VAIGFALLTACGSDGSGGNGSSNNGSSDNGSSDNGNGVSDNEENKNPTPQSNLNTNQETSGFSTLVGIWDISTGDPESNTAANNYDELYFVVRDNRTIEYYDYEGDSYGTGFNCYTKSTFRISDETNDGNYTLLPNDPDDEGGIINMMATANTIQLQNIEYAEIFTGERESQFQSELELNPVCAPDQEDDSDSTLISSLIGEDLRGEGAVGMEGIEPSPLSLEGGTWVQYKFDQQTKNYSIIEADGSATQYYYNSEEGCFDERSARFAPSAEGEGYVRANVDGIQTGFVQHDPTYPHYKSVSTGPEEPEEWFRITAGYADITLTPVCDYF